MSDYIAQDLLVLILKRLPVKTLLRCRIVCKPWKQLIASNSFILHHLALQKPRIIAQNGHLSYLLFDPQTLPSFEKLTPPFKFKREHRSYYGFTLSSHHGVNCLYNHAHLLLLHNPSIRQHLIIPLPKLPIFSRDDTFFCSGFWIDPSSNDFKILVFRLEYGVWNSKLAKSAITVQTRFHKSWWQDLLSIVSYDKSLFSNKCVSWVMRNGSWIRMFRIQLPQNIDRVHCVLGSRGRVLASNDTDRLVVHDPKDGFIRLKTSSNNTLQCLPRDPKVKSKISNCRMIHSETSSWNRNTLIILVTLSLISNGRIEKR